MKTPVFTFPSNDDGNENGNDDDKSPCRRGQERTTSRSHGSPWNRVANSQVKQKRRLPSSSRKQQQQHQQQTPDRPSNNTRALNTEETDSNGAVNPYKMLQIRKDATQHEIRTAYRHMALWYHPGRSSLSCGQATAATTTTEEYEKRQREHIFTVLAACCETLLERDSRTRLDSLLRATNASRMAAPSNTSRQWLPPLAVSSSLDLNIPRLTGSRSSVAKTNTAPYSTTIKTKTNAFVPMSSRSFSSYPDDDENDDDCYHKTMGQDDSWKRWSCGGTSLAPSATTFSSDNHNKPNHTNQLNTFHGHHHHRHRRFSLASCSTEEMDHVHYTQDETDRLFGGPFSLLYRARQFKAFMDPYQFFDRIFGSSLFPTANQKQQHCKSLSPQRFNLAPSCETPSKQYYGTTSPQSTLPLRSPEKLLLPRPSKNNEAESKTTSTWSGTCQVLPDGSTIYTTIRILRNRKLIKREHVTLNPVTGKKHSSITVTSEDLDDTPPHNNCPPANRADAHYDNEDDFDFGYWTCCSPMLALRGSRSTRAGGHDDSVETSPNTFSQVSSSTSPPPSPPSSPSSPSSWSLHGTDKASKNSPLVATKNIVRTPSTYFQRINCVW